MVSMRPREAAQQPAVQFGLSDLMTCHAMLSLDDSCSVARETLRPQSVPVCIHMTTSAGDVLGAVAEATSEAAVAAVNLSR